MVLFILSNVQLASPILQWSSDALPGIKLPTKINSLTFLIGSPSKLMFWDCGVNTLHLSVLTFISYLLQAWCNSVIGKWNFSNIKEIRVSIRDQVSSAYLTPVVRLSSVNSKSSDILSISFRINSRNILNSLGYRRYHCLKPTSIEFSIDSYANVYADYW